MIDATDVLGLRVSVVNKWHARVNFGSEATKAKMRVFNKPIFDQVRWPSPHEIQVYVNETQAAELVIST